MKHIRGALLHHFVQLSYHVCQQMTYICAANPEVQREFLPCGLRNVLQNTACTSTMYRTVPAAMESIMFFFQA